MRFCIKQRDTSIIKNISQACKNRRWLEFEATRGRVSNGTLSAVNF